MKNNKGLFIGVATVVVILIAGITVMATHNSNKTTPYSATKPAPRPAVDTSNAVASNSVTIQNYMFNAPVIKVKVGTTVTWTNMDGVAHSVSPDSPSADFPDGKLIGHDETYSFTFNKAGTYSYHCSPHPYMKASVIVTE